MEQCRKKWLNLLRKYKDLKNPPTGSGNEEGELQWPFFDLLDSIMSGRAIINPPRLVASASTAGNAEEPPSDEAAPQEDRSPQGRQVKKRKRSDDVTERVLSNMERQTNLMEKLFDFIVSRSTK